MSTQSNTPAIIKRKKVIQGGGHHGGAWKVAYADFVTAMMAFFMLMWLLGATTENQRKGIADYFNPTIPIVKASGGGQGAFGGDTVYSENTLAQNGIGAGLPQPVRTQGDARPENDDESSGQQWREELTDLERRLLAAGGESMSSDLIRRHVVTRLSDEGLVVELFDTDDTVMFDDDDVPTAAFEALLSEIVPLFALVENDIAVGAYVQAQPVVSRVQDRWERSVDRAAAVRKAIESVDALEPRVQRTTGYGSRTPAVESNPMSTRNNRIEITLLRNNV